MLGSVVEVVRHELVVALHTRRALLLALVYLGSATFGSLIYVLSVRLIEEQALKLLVAQGAQGAGATMRASGQEALAEMVAFFAGTQPDLLATSLSQSVVLPPLLWASLAFLPFLIVLTSFDQIAADAHSRAICYSVLRVRRSALLVGKMAAQSTIFALLSLLSSFVLFALAALLLKEVPARQTAVGLLRVWVMLLPYGLCYVSLAAMCSAAVRQPFSALVLAFSLMMVLRVVGWLVHVDPAGRLGLLHYLHHLSPAAYHGGLWQAGLAGPLTSCMAYVSFACAFTAAAMDQLKRRDL